MDFFNRLKAEFCCLDSEETEEVAKTELISYEIENKKQILSDMRILKENLIDFGSHLKSDAAVALSSAEIWLMPEHLISDNIESEFHPNYIEGCLPVKRDDKPTLILDLDNTLIFSTTKEPEYFDHEITINYNQKNQKIWIVERPHLQSFLNSLQEKYELVIFTAGIRQYGIKVIKKIDPTLRIDYLLDRRFCTVLGKNNKNQDIYVKNLKILGREMSRVLIIDDREYSFCLDQENGILIPSFDGDLADRCLIQLEEYLNDCLKTKDFRKMPDIAYK